MNRPLYFSKNELTKKQRRDVVDFAVGVSLSQSRSPSPLLMELQKRYIAGEIDLEQLSARIDAEYQPAPGPDSYARYMALVKSLIQRLNDGLEIGCCLTINKAPATTERTFTRVPRKVERALKIAR